MADLRSPAKAIRAYCLDCTAGQTKEVELCPIERCPLYPFRFGKNPFHTKREMTEEERAKRAKILEQAREKQKENRQVDKLP